MAVLNKIRQRSVFLIIIIALALFSFVLADVIRNGGFSSQKDQTTVGTVNGIDLPREDFMQQVELQQRNLGPNANATQAMNSVWEREVRRVLLEEQFEELGLTVEKEQINNALRTSLANNPTFQNEAGLFDEGKMQEYIADVKQNSPQLYQQWLDFETNTAQTLLQTTYYNMIKAGMGGTMADGEQAYRFENNKINMEYVYVPYSKIPDADVAVSNEEIQTYVKNHASEFEVEAQRDIQYVSFTEEPSQADIDGFKGEMASLLEDRIEGTDTIPGFRNATDNEAYINSNSDTGFVDRWWFKKDLPPTVADNIFALDKGGIYGPYQLNNSYNITKVLEVKQLPDSIQSKHILIRYEGTLRATPDVTRTKEDAKKLADSILTVVKRDDAKFAELAGKFSDDLSNKDKGGDLGYNAPGRMVPEFDAFTIDNKAGTVGVVETDFGYHVVKVEDQKNMQKAIKVAKLTKEIEASEKTINEVFANATKFEVASQKGDFVEVAKAQNVSPRPVNKIGRMDATIPGIGNNRTIVSWAFGEDAKVGDVKRFNVPNGYVIAQITRKSPKGLMSVSEASAKVTPILRNQKKAKKIREGISGDELQAIASSQGVSVQNATAVTMAAPTIPGAGSEPKVVGAAFGKKAGETTGLIDGKLGVYKVRVTAVNEAPKLDNYVAYTNKLNTATSPVVINNVYRALKKNAEIDDNRATFF
ncbi:peptidylprolyl isomerase [Cochleicola gelatinilyticus]|uniref:Periplasmic chaperone PpiD n=1 Tax=Cochleicola gelatinilyticus TaxID=1763537 RepID=A0A167IM76_9FLAO|nr:peptidylprolyl isomerase [Cochleicola gelatinilyticus]OAB79814.1 peptidylprolyl isomerase [Cochleicola gelatinilyticus]